MERFPAEDADYREALDALDLEDRSQIVTSSDDLRRAAIEAVKAGPTGRGAADGALVR